MEVVEVREQGTMQLGLKHLVLSQDKSVEALELKS